MDRTLYYSNLITLILMFAVLAAIDHFLLGSVLDPTLEFLVAFSCVWNINVSEKKW